MRSLPRRPPRSKQRLSVPIHLWSDNPAHPSLRFKKVHNTLPIYSVRVDLDWRALGVLKKEEAVIWFWIGPHSEYEILLSEL